MNKKIFYNKILLIGILFILFSATMIFSGCVTQNEPIPTASTTTTPSLSGITTIAIFGDAHTTESNDRVPQLTSDMNNYASLSPTGKIDAMFTTGDMEPVAKVDQAHQASTLKNIPLYYTIGNHDTGDVSKIEALQPTNLKINPGPTGNEKSSFSVEVGNIHVVILDAYWDGKTNEGWMGGGSSGGEIGTTLTNWLKDDLQSATTKYKIVMDHEPMYPIKRHVGNSLDYDTKSRDALQAILDSQGVDAFFAGHTHYATGVLHGGVLQVNDGVPGTKAGTDADSFRSVWFVNIATNGDLVITWKHNANSGSSWSDPIVKTWTLKQ